MKSQSLILLVVAGVCGLVALVGVKQALNSKGGENEETVEYLVASVDIGPGIVLGPENVRPVRVAVSAAPQDVAMSLEEITDRCLRVPATAGDPITRKKLTEPGERGTSVTIPPGMRVWTLTVEATQIHSGMLQPGNRIDLVLNYDSYVDGRAVTITRTVLQNVEVFAVDNQTQGAEEKGAAQAKTISVLVTPKDGTFLTMCQQKGKLTTMLKNAADDTDVQDIVMSEQALNERLNGSEERTSIREMQETLNNEEAGELSIADQLQNELAPVEDPGGSAPVLPVQPAAREMWTIEIHEGTKVRLEAIELDDSTTVGPAAGRNFWDFLKG
ncbi:MAG: Flp pilus assembly protein CpaB [Planctomycetaceae bacterium]|nr:Flp pilus assembly protein CpaB [Planctomycetaceae bacterium]